jgi:hypothetical protein
LVKAHLATLGAEVFFMTYTGNPLICSLALVPGLEKFSGAHHHGFLPRKTKMVILKK